MQMACRFCVHRQEKQTNPRAAGAPQVNFRLPRGTFPAGPVDVGARHPLPHPMQCYVTQMALEFGNEIQIQTRCPPEKFQWATGSWIQPTPGGCLLSFLRSSAHKTTSPNSSIQGTVIVLCGDHLMGIGGSKGFVVAPQHPRGPTEQPPA